MSSDLLILLVGSNPLPNYLAACALRPHRLALVFTAETQQAKDRLRIELVRELGEEICAHELFVDDATCATSIGRALEPVLAQRDESRAVLLNYTGGTKVMAAHARLAFAKKGGRAEDASYLDEGDSRIGPRLRFDDGTSRPLANEPGVPLTLPVLLALHGIMHQPRVPRSPAPTKQDAREILYKVLEDGPVAAELYRESERLKVFGNPNNATAESFDPANYGLLLSQTAIPTPEQLAQHPNRDERESWFKHWYKFIGGEWLEEWLGEQLQALKLYPAPEITVGLNGYRGQRRAQLEIDVAAIRGQRSYFVSCTTDDSKPICKSKLFEVAVRSRQLGGDLARSALVCLASDATVQTLQEDVNDVWGATNTVRVFGRSDILAWSDCGGKRPNWHSLRDWLET